MDPKEILITIAVAIVTCIATLIAKDLYESAKNKSPHKRVGQLENKIDNITSDMAILKESQKNQLWLSLTRTHYEYTTRGKATELEKAAIKESFDSYSSLGGNHGMETMIDEVMKLPIK